MDIYIAGASAELDRAKNAMAFVHSHPRLTLAHDWTRDIERERIQGGRQDHDLSKEERVRYASQILQAITGTPVFWLLVPHEGVHTTGAWVELGAALIYRTMLEVLGVGNSIILSSGPQVDHHLFAALGLTFETDEEAISWLKEASDA